VGGGDDLSLRMPGSHKSQSLENCPAALGRSGTHRRNRYTHAVRMAAKGLSKSFLFEPRKDRLVFRRGQTINPVFEIENDAAQVLRAKILHTFNDKRDYHALTTMPKRHSE
jgi:hypothetical protein